MERAASLQDRQDKGANGADSALRPRLLTALLDRAVADHGDRTAIDFMGRRWRYADIGDLVDRAARGLQDQGLKPGDRVGLCLPNTPYFVILYFAVLRAGGIVVNFNPLYVEGELNHQIVDSGAVMMAVVDVADIHARLVAAARGTDVRRIIVCPMADILPTMLSWGYRLFKRRDIAHIPADGMHVRFDALTRRGHAEPVTMAPDDIAVLQYTGGTTGVPKGAMLTHANLTANSGQMLLHVHDERPMQERTLGVLPMFHVFGLTTVLNYSIEIAAEMILLPRFEMAQVLKTIRRTRPTQVFGVPTMWTAFNGLPDDQVPDLSMVRACVSGGAPLPLEVKETFERRTRAVVVEGYGLTEASPIIACNPLDGENKKNSCGPAFPHTVLEIRDPDEPHRLMPQGERGEVCARGPQVMKGYWNRPDATEKTFVDGALRTGDIGYLDEDGYLFLVDRIKDLIIASGFNVYPRAIEDAAYRHPAVKEAIAIGIHDAYRGQSPKLFLALNDGMSVTEEEMRAHLSHELSKIEMPSEIAFRDHLPRTLVGKLSKKELVAEEAARREAGA